MHKRILDRPLSTIDLLPSERRMLRAIQDLQFGRFERLRVEGGELCLEPWPSTVKNIKFAADPLRLPSEQSTDFDLKRQFAEFFEEVRHVGTGSIRSLEVRHGLPFSMELQQPADGEKPCD